MKYIRMRQERLKNNWTLKDVANEVGTSAQTIQRIETGKRKPSFELLVKLENLFQKNYRELFNLPKH